jgi:uncharacterized protein
MKRIGLSGILAATLLLVAGSAPIAAQGIREGKMRILGRGVIEVVPDHATVRVGVVNKAASPTVALDQNSAVARKIIAFAKTFGVAEQDLRTEAVDLVPAFKTIRDPNGSTRQEPDGYNASNSVHVKLNDITRLGTFMRQVLDHGANNIVGVRFGLSDPDKSSDQARTRAVEDAVHRAQQLADAAKVKLGGVVEIVHPPRIEFRREDGLADMPLRQTRMSVPVEVGTITIAAEVDITWKIE